MKKKFFREDIAVEDKYRVVKDLYQTLPINKKRIDVAKIKMSIHLVVANLVFHEDSILIEHFSNRYKVSPHRSFKTERRVILLLKELGYLNVYRGLSNKALNDLRVSGQDVSMHIENGKNRLSSMWLTDKGKEYFTGVDASLELVTRRKKIKATKTNKKRYEYFPFQADEFEDVEKYEDFLIKLNDLMSKYTFRYVAAKTGEIIEFKNDYRVIFSGNESNKIYDYTRRGGRFVSEVSYMWKQNRLSITINGKRTLEIDYKCSLPSIMFGKFGIDLSALNNDLYSVPGENNCEYMRQLAKTIVVCMLGVTSEYTLELSLRKKFEGYKKGYLENDYPIERFFPENFEFEDIKRVAKIIIERYRRLCPKVDDILFKTDLATNILQGIEARIATRIMNKFVQMDKPILCIHDSFRVLEEDEGLLYKLMKEVYIGEVGMKPLGLKIDRQPQQDLQVNTEEIITNITKEEIAPVEPEVVLEATRIAQEDIGEIDCASDVNDIEYVHEGRQYKFNLNTNQDFVYDDSGFDMGWIAQGSRNTYDLHIGVV